MNRAGPTYSSRLTTMRKASRNLIRANQEQAFWNDMTRRLLEPFGSTIQAIVARMIWKTPLRRLPPELARIAKPLRAARRQQSRV